MFQQVEKTKIEKLLNGIKSLERKNAVFLHLVANENQMSQTANSFLSSKLSERYYFGGGERGVVDMDIFTFLGLRELKDLITAAEKALSKMLFASEVNLNCLSGIHTMLTALLSVTEPGDTVMTIKEKDGGHFATKKILEKIGRKQIFAVYNTELSNFDASRTARLFKKHRAKIIYLDALSIINPINLEEIRDSLGKNPIIIYDASHTAGLIVGQEFQKPLLEGADIVTANTHKSFPGPQKGFIAFKDKDRAREINPIAKGFYSSAHTHHLIALGITILEMEHYGKQYAKQIIKSSQSLGCALSDLGFELRRTPDGYFSKNHQLQVFLNNRKDRIKLYSNLINNNISTNFISYPGERMYMRIGTQEITRRGMKEPEMKEIASLINQALKGKNVKGKIIALNKKFSKIHYSFDSFYENNKNRL